MHLDWLDDAVVEQQLTRLCLLPSIHLHALLLDLGSSACFCLPSPFLPELVPVPP